MIGIGGNLFLESGNIIYQCTILGFFGPHQSLSYNFLKHAVKGDDIVSVLILILRQTWSLNAFISSAKLGGINKLIRPKSRMLDRESHL